MTIPKNSTFATAILLGKILITIPEYSWVKLPLPLPSFGKNINNNTQILTGEMLQWCIHALVNPFL